jgi:hypothetical protein
MDFQLDYREATMEQNQQIRHIFPIEICLLKQAHI